jgi:hypothetical protein
LDKPRAISTEEEFVVDMAVSLGSGAACFFAAGAAP